MTFEQPLMSIHEWDEQDFPETRSAFDALPHVWWAHPDVLMATLIIMTFPDGTRVVLYPGDFGWYRVGFPSEEAIRAVTPLENVVKH